MDHFKLSTRSSDFPGLPASLILGGVTIYASQEQELLSGFKTVADAIEECAMPHLSLTRKTLNSQVREHLGFNVDRAIFGAILGSRLRLGILDSIPCAAVTGKVLRVYVHNQQLDTFHNHLETAVVELRLRRVVQVPDIEEKLFGQRYWGTWSSTFHILARLVQIGRACYVDEKAVCWPMEIENAINKSLRRVRVIKPARLGHDKKPTK